MQRSLQALLGGAAVWRARAKQMPSQQCAARQRHPSASRYPRHPLQHSDDEYGVHVNDKGEHYGGPFTIQVSPKMRVDEVRKVIRVSCSGEQGGPDQGRGWVQGCLGAVALTHGHVGTCRQACLPT